MALKKPLQRTFHFRRHDDVRLVTRTERLIESHFGADQSLTMALGSTHREALLLGRDQACAVVIVVQQPDGGWERNNVVQPPWHMR